MIQKGKEITLRGRVKSGLGRGRYFMSQSHYRKQFLKIFGMKPFRGTLNLSLGDKGVKSMKKIKRMKPILVKGYNKGGKKFGDVLCYRVIVAGIECILVIPKLSTHLAVAEVVSQKKLRKELKLKDGDSVKMSVKT